VCWRVDLRQPPLVVKALTAVLSHDEQDRAARFAFARDRRRFLVTRACLRTVVGHWLRMSPDAIRFTYGPHGMPSVSTEAAEPPIHFSVSHSDDLALIALFPDQPLGIDVEAVRPVPDLRNIVRYLHPVEARTIAALGPDIRTLAFFLCWTRKEAFSKALGRGFSISLDRYRVTCCPGEAARIVEIDGSQNEAAEWSVFDLRPAPGYVGAVVTRAAPTPPTVIELSVERDVVPALVPGVRPPAS
jgi:4'-phosphopantetheinyl transferase